MSQIAIMLRFLIPIYQSIKRSPNTGWFDKAIVPIDNPDMDCPLYRINGNELSTWNDTQHMFVAVSGEVDIGESEWAE